MVYYLLSSEGREGADRKATLADSMETQAESSTVTPVEFTSAYKLGRIISHRGIMGARKVR
jgi:hypothetical protein